MTSMSAIIIRSGTVTVPKRTAHFIARDHFVVSTSTNAPVKISVLGRNFKNWFLGKTEGPFGGSTLEYGKLSYGSADRAVEELSREEKAETTLTELFSLIEAQKGGEGGPLLTNGYANIFYIRDACNVVRALDVYWNEDGWGVAAFDLVVPFEGNLMSQLFSRDFQFTPGYPGVFLLSRSYCDTDRNGRLMIGAPRRGDLCAAWCASFP